MLIHLLKEIIMKIENASKSLNLWFEINSVDSIDICSILITIYLFMLREGSLPYPTLL